MTDMQLILKISELPPEIREKTFGTSDMDEIAKRHPDALRSALKSCQDPTLLSCGDIVAFNRTFDKETYGLFIGLSETKQSYAWIIPQDVTRPIELPVNALIPTGRHLGLACMDMETDTVPIIRAETETLDEEAALAVLSGRKKCPRTVQNAWKDSFRQVFFGTKQNT